MCVCFLFLLVSDFIGHNLEFKNREIVLYKHTTFW